MLQRTRGLSEVYRKRKVECQNEAVQTPINYFLGNMGKAEAK